MYEFPLSPHPGQHLFLYVVTLEGVKWYLIVVRIDSWTFMRRPTPLTVDKDFNYLAYLKTFG